MKRVVVESPLRADTAEGRERNKYYARLCMLDSLRRGEAPFASHVLYDHADLLNDADANQRRMGMEAGFAWGAKAQLVAVYVDLGTSEGMREGVRRAIDHDIGYVFRNLHGDLWKRFAARYECWNGQSMYGKD